jgi:hypothetical protein
VTGVFGLQGGAFHLVAADGTTFDLTIPAH